MSRIRHPNGSKLTKNWKNDNDFRISWHDVIINFFFSFFFDVVLFLLTSLVTGHVSCQVSCFKFHVNITTGSGVIIISFYRDWQEIRISKYPCLSFAQSGDWDELEIPDLVFGIRYCQFWQGCLWWNATECCKMSGL